MATRWLADPTIAFWAHDGQNPRRLQLSPIIDSYLHAEHLNSKHDGIIRDPSLNLVVISKPFAAIELMTMISSTLVMGISGTAVAAGQAEAPKINFLYHFSLNNNNDGLKAENVEDKSKPGDGKEYATTSMMQNAFSAVQFSW